MDGGPRSLISCESAGSSNQMRRALEGQLKSEAQGLYRYALHGGRGPPVTQIAHLISGCPV